MSESNGSTNGHSNGHTNGHTNGQSTIEIEPTGKWQVYWVNADGHKTMPASTPGSFRGAVAFCRGWTAGAIRNGLGQIREGLFPVPFKLEEEKTNSFEGVREDQSDAWLMVWDKCKSLGMQTHVTGRGVDIVTDFIQGLVDAKKSVGSIMDVVNGHPSRSHVINPALNMKAPLSMADIDRLNAELSQEAEAE